jgi:multidrug efflux pump subunit AcrB
VSELEAKSEAKSGWISIVRLFVRHHTAANLLMALMIILGLYSLVRLNTQFFPDFGVDVVSISVEWPGASAEDIDENIVEPVEPEVRFLDQVKHVRSVSTEGLAQISVEFQPGSDMQAAMTDVETAVGQVTTLPEDSERPEIRRHIRYDSISRLVLSGPYPEAALKATAKRIRDDLLARGIDKVTLFGAREEEIWVELDTQTLRRLDLRLDDVAARIRAASQDLPSGDTGGSTVQNIRSLGLVKKAEGIRQIEVRSFEDGRKIYVGDIAQVDERFEEEGYKAWRNGHRAIEIHVQRATTADALEVAAIVDDYLVEFIPTLPANLSLERYAVMADLIHDRIFLLLKNGLSGLVLVVTILFVFLNIRVAFWVTAAIPVTMLATMLVMLATGQSINMVSLFGLIMALGIIVDDAIVVSEHAEYRHQRGDPPEMAAELGVRRMTAPVVSASLTTICAFIPLFAISGVIGQIVEAIPLVIVSIILASLIECFLVLPAHLKGALGHEPSALRQRFNRGFDLFRDGPFRRLVTWAIEWRYLTIAAAIACFVCSMGLVLGARVGFVFFPQPEADRIYANVRMAASSSRQQTEAMLQELERALVVAEEHLTDGEGGLVMMRLAKLGNTSGGGGANDERGDHIASMAVELEPSDSREIRTEEVIDAWRAELHEIPVVEALTIRPATAGPPGREVDIRLSGEDIGALKTVAQEIQVLLARYPGVTDIKDDLPYGKEDLILELTPHGRALGFTTESVARQVRGAFEGVIAQRFPRGDKEITVRVQFSRKNIGADILDHFYLRSPTDSEVALSEVVSIRSQQGFSLLKREDGKRQVAITAELAEDLITTDKVIEALERDGVRTIASQHEIDVSFSGKAEEQTETLADMRLGALIGLSSIYIILAWVFASYTRPLVVMSLIPLGFVGATLGHWILGFDLTMLSMIALVGLSGIVVNDSIILVSTIRDRLESGESMHEAIVMGACERFRAVILTSATTIGGLSPLMFETSLQAQFLIPMAITISFGLFVTTFLVLLVIPALIAVQSDCRRFSMWASGKVFIDQNE